MQKNQKNKIIIFLIACAVICSGLAIYLIWSFMTPSRSTVYVFNDDYSAGEQVTSDMLTPIQVDSTIVVAGNSTDVSTQFVTGSDYSDVIRSGDYLRIDVSEGMPLTTSMLSVTGGSTIEINMTSDSIAVSFQVNQFTGVTNDLKAGAKVNIYSCINSSVQLIQQNKRILEVFTDDDGTITGVAVEETIYESMELIYAINNGSIYLGLVDGTGYQSSEGSDPTYTLNSADTYTYSSSVETETETNAESETESIVSTETESTINEDASTEATSESDDLMDYLESTGELDEALDSVENQTEVADSSSQDIAESTDTGTSDDTVFVP